MAEYKLSYTGAQINEKLGMVDVLSSKINNMEIPTKTSDLDNDNGFVTETYVNDIVAGIPQVEIATDDEVLEMITELNIVIPIMDSNNKVYTANNGAIYTL